ncbi:MAG: alpha/beta fold hydrolase [Chloroflexota bacterium]|nr:alpha/beta fold hydrolase [Chloroflexota bacterium]
MPNAVTYHVPGATLTEREHTVPLDHAATDGPRISVFTREVSAEGGEAKPYLLFLQGGPGMEATRPTAPPTGWMKRALRDYRVLLLDQRGVGRSTPVGAQIPGATPQEQANYLTHFRADSIVRDSEVIRQELNGGQPWSVLGQSFGGFTSMAYLSIAPHGLREAFITGGLSPIGRTADEVYSRTWQRAIAKSKGYFERFPDDRQRARDIFKQLADEDVRLPGGDRLTANRFRMNGMWLGRSDGWELIHNLLELPFGSAAFLWDAEAGASHFQRNPIYATLHESSYADGVATRWSAARTKPAEVDADGYFCGEHIYPEMWQDYGGLRAHAAAAQILAEYEWPRLYDAAVLRQNDVPVAASIYTNDLYVDRDFALESAATIRGLKAWETAEFEHNGLRADGERVFSTLFDLLH